MAESISFSAVNATEEITFAATIDSEEIVFRYTDAARGPAGDGGGGGSVTSYVDDIESLPDYPTSFPTTPADINNVGTSKLLGRHGAGTGTAQEIGIDGGLELHGGNLRRAAVTGPVTIAAGGSVSAIADGALTISMVSELENILNATASAEEVANKQDILVSGTNIKTVAGQSLLGSTNIPALLTDPTGITGAAALTNIVSLTQAQYDAIGSKSSTTLYIIT